MFDLGREAARFAGDITHLLNNTICQGIRLSSVVSMPGRAVVGFQLSATNLTPRTGIPITLGRKAPSGYLGISVRLGIDSRKRYLAVQSSSFGFYLDEAVDRMLVRYDYERDKGDGYPEAHLQINGSSPVWDELCDRFGRDRPLEHLHFPVGGRRYRPTVEDLIDFLVTEGIAEARPRWAEHVEQGRNGFRRKQLGAAVANDPAFCADELRSLGYRVTAPDIAPS